jgi:CheY-like chemotaxis protein
VFHVRLPLAAPKPIEEEREDERKPPAERRPRPRKVMVVDDDVENARMLAEVLREEGYEVAVAYSGKEARGLWDAGNLEAALLDALMPDMSGWAIAREIREKSPNALIAVITGGDVRGQNRENLALVDAVFRKPVDVGALDEFLSQCDEPAGEETEEEAPTVH